MKNVKSIICIAITVCMLIGFSTVGFAAPSEKDMYYGLTVMEKMGKYDKLSEIYDTILEGLNAGEAEIDMDSLNASWDEVTLVYKLILHDHPEIFWVSGASTGSVSDHVVTFSPTYTMTGSAITTAKSKLNSAVSSLTSGLSGKSDYEKSLILHDRLIDRVEYKFGNNHQTSYGALVEKEAVCAGYARAYQLLLHKVGIPAWYVVGESVNPATNRREAHAWNLVQLDGDWYYTDTTWDDQGDVLHYAYFNLTKAQISENHIFGEFSEYLPTATATEHNYFVKNGLQYSSFDLARITAAFKKDKTIRTYVTDDVNKFKADFMSNIQRIVGELNVEAGSSINTSAVTMGREVILTLNIVSPSHTHSLKLVKRVEPTCLAKGNIAYYTCDCGHWYTDAEAKNEIVDKESVKLPVIDHTPSGWVSDLATHHKNCTKCNALINGSTAEHSDANDDHKCDVCSAELPTPESGIVVGGNTASIPDTPSDETSSSDNATDETVSDAENATAKTSADNNQEAELQKLLIIIIGGVVLVAGIAVGIVLATKKKRDTIE